MVSTKPSRPRKAGGEARAVLDIEASGFGRNSYPVEIGFVLPGGEAYCSLIRPAANWTHWDPAAEALHGIALRTVVAHGRDVAEVVAHLNDRLHGRTVYCDGWAHDFVWLSVLFEAAGRSPSFRLDNLRSLLSEKAASRWSATRQDVAADMQLPRHRASSDAKVLQRTLMLLTGPLWDQGRRTVPTPADGT